MPQDSGEVKAPLRFPKRRRLRKRREFERVLAGPALVLSNAYWRVLAAPGEGEARLGIAVSKRRIRKAVARNRLKRIVRECFRHQHGLPPLDIVVMARAAAGEAENRALWEALEALFEKLRTSWAEGSASSFGPTGSS